MRNEDAQTTFLVVTFQIQDALFGINSIQVEEIVRIPPITFVPGAPSYVLGIVNLRGRILTVLDVSDRLGLGKTEMGEETRILVVSVNGESFGAVVPKLSDVVEAQQGEIKQMGRGIKGVAADHFLGLFERGDRLIALLDPHKTLMAS